MRDIAIRYKSEFKKIELMISKIKSLGFDTGEYENILHNINNKISNDVKSVYLSDKLVEGRLDQVYSRGILELGKLETLLERYSVYFQVFNSCNYIDIKLKDGNISLEELEKSITQMILNLKRIVNSDTIDYEKEKLVVEKAYDTAYNIIKLELIMTGDSQLYQYAASMDMNTYFFSELILKEINLLDLNDKEREIINAKIYSLDSNGINNNYFDLELIKLLLVHDNNINLKDSILKRLKVLESKIISMDTTISDDYAKTRNYHESVMESKRDIKEWRKEVFKRIISTILTYSIIITGGIGIERLSRKNATKDSYLKTTEIYSSLDDSTVSLEPEKVFDVDSSRDVYVREYEPWKISTFADTSRKYREFNVSHLDFDTAREYYDYGIDNYGVEYTKDKEYIPEGKSVDDLILYQDNYIEVLMSEYEYEGVSLDKKSYAGNLCLSYFGYLIVLLFVGGARKNYTDYFSQISYLMEAIVNLKDNKGYYKENYKILQENIDKLMNVINSNEEYRNKFNQLYEENKFLLENPEELYRRINELEKLDKIEEAKKLVREYKKK